MKPAMTPVDTPDKLFHDGSPETGVLGDEVHAVWLNAVQASAIDLQTELAAILTAAKMVPDGSKPSQVLAALGQLFISSGGRFGPADNGTNLYSDDTRKKFHLYVNNDGTWGAWDDVNNRALPLSVLNGGTADTTDGTLLPVGVPVPYPLATPPAGWVQCRGQSFTAQQYPKLAKIYTGLIIPDLRGEFIRGLDDGRGADAGRGVLTAQSPTYLRTGMMDYNGTDADNSGVYVGMAFGGADTATKSLAPPSGTFRAPGNTDVNAQGLQDNGVTGSASNTVYSGVGSTWISTRPRNVAFNYIMRAF